MISEKEIIEILKNYIYFDSRTDETGTLDWLIIANRMYDIYPWTKKEEKLLSKQLITISKAILDKIKEKEIILFPSDLKRIINI